MDVDEELAYVNKFLSTNYVLVVIVMLELLFILIMKILCNKLFVFVVVQCYLVMLH